MQGASYYKAKTKDEKQKRSVGLLYEAKTKGEKQQTARNNK